MEIFKLKNFFIEIEKNRTFRLSMFFSLIDMIYFLYSSSPLRRSGWFSYVGSPNPSPKSSYNCVDEEETFCTLDDDGVNATATLAVIARKIKFRGAMVENLTVFSRITLVL